MTSRQPPRVLVVVQKPTSTAGRIGRLLAARGYALELHGPSLDESLPRSLESYAAVAVFGGRNERQCRAPAVHPPTARLAARGGGLGQAPACRVLRRTASRPQSGCPGRAASRGPWRDRLLSRGAPARRARGLSPDSACLRGFDLPRGAKLLATGDRFPHQAFRIGEVGYGLQFHPEVTPDMVDRWTTTGAARLGQPGAQSREQQMDGARRHDSDLEAWSNRFLDLWLGGG